MKRLVTVMMTAALLSGYATNALRLDYAGDVAAQAETAANASRKFLTDVEKTRTEANLDLIAADPNCTPLFVYLRRVPDVAAISDPDDPPRGWLCAKQPVAGVTQNDPYSLEPIGNELEPTLILIASLGAYGAAINDILEQEGGDAAQDIADSVALAGAAENLLRSAIGGKRLVPAADDPRLTSITAFVAFLQELQTEQDKVDDLRALVASSTGNEAIIRDLRDHLRSWEIARASDVIVQRALADTIMGVALRGETTPGERRALVAPYYQRAADQVTAARLAPALDAVLGELQAADADLRRVLKQNPDLTPAERARVARLNRQRLTRAFNGLADILTAFKGV